jgi:hypothetical protein
MAKTRNMEDYLIFWYLSPIHKNSVWCTGRWDDKCLSRPTRVMRLIVWNKLHDCSSTTNVIYHFLYGLVYADGTSDYYTALTVGRSVNDALERIWMRTVRINMAKTIKKTLVRIGLSWLTLKPHISKYKCRALMLWQAAQLLFITDSVQTTYMMKCKWNRKEGVAVYMWWAKLRHQKRPNCAPHIWSRHVNYWTKQFCAVLC